MNTRHKRRHDPTSTAFRAALCGLALTLTLAGSAFAGEHAWDIGFGFGSAGVGDSDLDLRAELRSGYRFTDRFSLEGEL